MTGTRPVLIDTIDEIRHALASHRAKGKRIGLVPTMGALHAGHASLIHRARSECDIVVVSIYVNPTQFGPGEDFNQYPRRLQADLDTCAHEQVDLVFAPSDKEMYGDGSLTSIHMNKLADGLCGAVRPGHFDGVCLIVTKLFNIVQPGVAYFGQKDAQQVVVLKRLVRDLNLPVEIAVCPIIREPDGLAMSSRNAYLNAEQRRQALCLSRGLRVGCEAIRSGVRTSSQIAAIMRRVVRDTGLSAIDYLDAFDAETLKRRAEVAGTVLLAGAIRIGPTRLIDNIVVDAEDTRGTRG